mgnify:CR=1 FL=1
MTLLLPIVFILYPLGSLPLVLVEIYNKRKYAFVLLAIFMGLWSIFYYRIYNRLLLNILQIISQKYGRYL